MEIFRQSYYDKNMKDISCPKCLGKMEKGFIGDKETMGQQTRQTWGTGILPLGSGLVHAIAVTTYRCLKCGYLESYAE